MVVERPSEARESKPTEPPRDLDPWLLEAARPKAPAQRPELGPVGPGAILALGLLAALRALGLVLVAGAVAAGVAGLQAGTLDGRSIVLLGALGAVLRAGSGWAVDAVARRLAITVKSTLRSRLWRRIADGDAGRDGSVAVLATDGLEDLDDYYVRSLPAMIAAVVVPAVVGLRILGADWVSALVVVVTVPLVPFFMVLIGRHTQARTDEALGALARLADHLTELARGLPVLVGLNRVDEQSRALDGIQRAYRARTQETLRWAFLSSLALELIATISVAVVAVFLGLRLMQGSVGLEAALLVLILAPECYAVLRDVGTAFHASQDGLSALQRVRGILARPRRADVRGASPAGRLSLRDLTVRYAGRETPTVDGLDADVAGIVAVTGPSGAGKSTLLAALAGVLPADADVSGTIRGVAPDGVAYAAQAPRAFAATPREELALHGAADPAAALAELGLKHVADAQVAELSPGELRRLAVARALARVDQGAPLLVLDEPTAHLDRTSADRVRAAILARAERATVVLAAHEPETLALAGTRIEVGGAGGSSGPAPRSSSGASASERRRNEPKRPTAVAPTAPAPASPARPWVAGIALAFAAVALGLALSAVSGWLIVRASVEEHIMYLLVAIVGVRFFGIGRSVARYAERLATHEAAFRVVDALRLRLWRAIAARGAGSRRLLEGGSPVDYLVTLSGELRDLLPRVIPPLASGVLTVAGIGVTAALVLPEVAGRVLLVVVSAVAIGSLLAITTSRAAQRARIRERSALVRGTASLAAAADDLRANAAADAALSVLAEADARLADAERRVAWASGAGTAAVVLACSALAFLVPVWAPGAPAELACVIALLSLAAAEPLTDLVAAAHRLPALTEVRHRLAPVLAEPAPVSTGTATPASPVWELRLDGVAARYPGAAAPVFAPIDGAVRTGQWLAVGGPSGSGKSTLLSVVMGALPAAAGAVRIDGVPLTELDLAAWRERVAWCPQDAYVFDSTLRANLLLARGRDDAPTDGEMRAVLERSGLGALLRRLPEGLDTRVGPCGAALSGGERQRLAIARTLLTRADVILLDEPTAHLDAPTAAAVMADVRRATEDRIVLLVSHRAADVAPGDAAIPLGA
ncbi:thiol reductant ABC exporter subunit CydC [Microbacterium sp. Root53]|uniref:thiol reductant ABC exporter subunit CydC n=1 Tax=Microbacterium sp. Root53 TaxID=1736553 RepID=UPI0009E79692|nr:thiol reductant ABC exporter subunit CydC [Microbacterium sp. Root53]